MAKFYYRMIAEKICADIKSGELVPGMPIPSSRELAERFEVSQLTAIHALKHLVQKGILLHKPGKNYSVARKEDTQKNACRFLTLLFRYISTKGPEFYGNRIISGIMDEIGLSSVGTYFCASPAHIIRSQTTDFSAVLEEALMLPKQNIGFVADYFIPDKIIEEIIFKTRLPVVVIGRKSQLSNVHSVVLNTLPGYRFLYKTLKRLGYDGFICCETYDVMRDECLQQQMFFQELALTEKTVSIPQFNAISSVRQGELLRHALKQLAGKRVAILSPSDYSARKIIEFLEEENLKVPEQIGVTGFYGTRIATDFSPTLCCLSVLPEQLGKTAARLLLSNDTHYQIHEIPMDFVFGKTV